MWLRLGLAVWLRLGLGIRVKVRFQIRLYDFGAVPASDHSTELLPDHDS